MVLRPALLLAARLMLRPSLLLSLVVLRGLLDLSIVALLPDQVRQGARPQP